MNGIHVGQWRRACALARPQASRQDVRASAVAWLDMSSQRFRFGEKMNALDQMHALRLVATVESFRAAFAPAATRSAATYVFVQPDALLKMGRAPLDGRRAARSFVRTRSAWRRAPRDRTSTTPQRRLPMAMSAAQTAASRQALGAVLLQRQRRTERDA